MNKITNRQVICDTLLKAAEQDRGESPRVSRRAFKPSKSAAAWSGQACPGSGLEARSSQEAARWRRASARLWAVWAEVTLA